MSNIMCNILPCKDKPKQPLVETPTSSSQEDIDHWRSIVGLD